MLELGKAGSAGVEKGTIRVVRDGAVVATLRASNWKEAATAVVRNPVVGNPVVGNPAVGNLVVGNMEWIYAKGRRELTARAATDPEAAAVAGGAAVAGSAG